jgi:SOS-response transcriptional repressor LexA
MSREDADFGAWLTEQLARRELTQADFARLGPFSTANVSRWLHEGRSPLPKFCLRIAAVLGLDEDLVLRAAGHKPAVPLRDRPRSFDDIMHELAAERPISVPLLEQLAGAGQGENAIGYVYLPPMGRRPKGLFAMRVKGACMEPRICDGDTIIVDREQTWQLGKIVVAVVGEDWDRVLVKRLVERGGRYWLEPNHGDPILVDANVKVVGVVTKIISDA